MELWARLCVFIIELLLVVAAFRFWRRAKASGVIPWPLARRALARGGDNSAESTPKPDAPGAGPAGAPEAARRPDAPEPRADKAPDAPGDAPADAPADGAARSRGPPDDPQGDPQGDAAERADPEELRRPPPPARRPPVPPKSPEGPALIPVRLSAAQRAEVLERFLQDIEPPVSQHNEAIFLLRRIRRVLQPTFPRAQVLAFGSAMNGFGSSQCDLDLDLSQPIEAESRYETAQAQRQVLVQAIELLGQQGFKVERTALSAKVPVGTLVDLETQRSIDLTVNNSLPFFNTKLLRYYSKLHPCVRQLVLLVKHWAKSRGVAGAKSGNLSSYAWTLMVIYYLQVGAPGGPLIPSLQKMAHDISEGLATWAVDDKTYDVSMVSAITCLKTWDLPEVPALTELLHGFFAFYANRFSWEQGFLSIRLPQGSRKDACFSAAARAHLGGVLWIEDPIEVSRNLNCVLTVDTLPVLREELNLAASLLEDRCSLAQLMPAPRAKKWPKPKRWEPPSRSPPPKRWSETSPLLATQEPPARPVLWPVRDMAGVRRQVLIT